MQTIPALQEGTDQLGRTGGFSLHAGVAVNTRERKKLERICRSGPAGISLAPRYRKIRLELTDQGMLSYVGAAFRLKTAYPKPLYQMTCWRLVSRCLGRVVLRRGKFDATRHHLHSLLDFR